MTQPVNLGENYVPIVAPDGTERDIRNLTTMQPQAPLGDLRTVDQQCVILVDSMTNMPLRLLTEAQGNTIIRLLKDISKKL